MDMDSDISDSELGNTPSKNSIRAPSGRASLEDPVEEMRKSLNKSTVKDLKKKLSEKGLPINGLKKELIARVVNAEIMQPKLQTPKRVNKLIKSVSSPSLTSKRSFNGTPNNPKSKKSKPEMQNSRSGRNTSRANQGPPRAGSSLRNYGSRLRSPSPMSSNSKSLFGSVRTHNLKV